MNRPRLTRRIRWPMFAAAAIAGTLLPLQAENAAVSTRIFNGYARTRLADGSFKPETYAFADGGRWDAMPGDSINEFPFRQLVGTLAVPMNQRGYVSAKDPEKTDLLIFVFWGATRGTADQAETPARQNLLFAMGQTDTVKGPDVPVEAKQAMAQRTESYFTMADLEQKMRNRVDVQNAMILGFQDDLWRVYDLDYSTPSADFMHDLQSDRYFVVLKAFDFRSAWKEKHRKILWEARFSVMRRGIDFVESLPAMAYQASRYFGEDSGGVVRRPLPDVKITFGDTKTIRIEAVK